MSAERREEEDLHARHLSWWPKYWTYGTGLMAFFFLRASAPAERIQRICGEESRLWQVSSRRGTLSKQRIRVFTKIFTFFAPIFTYFHAISVSAKVKRPPELSFHSMFPCPPEAWGTRGLLGEALGGECWKTHTGRLQIEGSKEGPVTNFVEYIYIHHLRHHFKHHL